MISLTHTARTSRTSRTAALAVTALLTLAACAAADDASTPPPTSTATPTSVSATDPAGSTDAATETEQPVIMISGSVFQTSELRVAPGTTVVWQNSDPFAHTVTSRDGAPAAFDSGEFKDGGTFEFTFDEPGEYAYFCRIHPTMRAVVIVG